MATRKKKRKIKRKKKSKKRKVKRKSITQIKSDLNVLSKHFPEGIPPHVVQAVIRR